MDHGPEFTIAVFTAWCESHRIEHRSAQPGNAAPSPARHGADRWDSRARSRGTSWGERPACIRWSRYCAKSTELNRSSRFFPKGFFPNRLAQLASESGAAFLEVTSLTYRSNACLTVGMLPGTSGS